MFDLRIRFRVIDAVPPDGAFERALSEKGNFGLTLRRRKRWKLIAQVLEREAQSIGEFHRVGRCFRDVSKQLQHLFARLQVQLGVATEKLPNVLEGLLVT